MTHVPRALRSAVRSRSGQRCEYCHLPESPSLYPFHAEHIIAVQHHGLTVSENLAWACFQCNTFKGPNIASYDLDTGVLTPLYNPRTQDWNEHFNIVDGFILGLTAVGRVTTDLLQFNALERLGERVELISSGKW